MSCQMRRHHSSHPHSPPPTNSGMKMEGFLCLVWFTETHSPSFDLLQRVFLPCPPAPSSFCLESQSWKDLSDNLIEPLHCEGRETEAQTETRIQVFWSSKQHSSCHRTAPGPLSISLTIIGVASSQPPNPSLFFMAENTGTNPHNNAGPPAWLWPLSWHMPQHTHIMLPLQPIWDFCKIRGFLPFPASVPHYMPNHLNLLPRADQAWRGA